MELSPAHQQFPSARSGCQWSLSSPPRAALNLLLVASNAGSSHVGLDGGSNHGIVPWFFFFQAPWELSADFSHFLPDYEALEAEMIAACTAPTTAGCSFAPGTPDCTSKLDKSRMLSDHEGWNRPLRSPHPTPICPTMPNGHVPMSPPGW